ncbi:hypothetical protein ATKI12_0509 [Kitasatospora sp. Ki12]|uniref:hypothetical protein n=1 Tax=Kitasatospora xanthocidica TaxID=83382 RepID=UPI001675693D|nr:hypothetical protein [Kitasatospora xanthocidica]GHF74688.1 hypothetical protein GCM10018790_60620 [Kitasatospora xanthocidica]
MPVFPEEPEIHESLPGPGVPFPRESDAQALRAPATGAPATAPTTVAAPAAVPGPRPAPPRPAPPRAARPGPPGLIPKPGPAPRRPAPAAPKAEVQRIAATPAQAVERADDAVDRLLDSGRDPGEVLVLTVGEAHPWQQHELSFGEERYWAQLTDGGDVFYADAALDRPVRREVVVLVVNGGTPARAAKAYAEALDRATALLLVCGDAGPATAVATGAAPARPVKA